MRKLHLSMVVLAALAALSAPVPGFAQTPPGGQAQTPPADQPPALRIGLGDFMTMSVQPRHIKLAIAAKEKNWRYAAYELHELQECWDRVVRYFPKRGQVSLADMAPAVTRDPMAELYLAINNKDSHAFDAAYKELTEGCNACHQANDRAMVVIQIPKDASFADQDFRPAKE